MLQGLHGASGLASSNQAHFTNGNNYTDFTAQYNPVQFDSQTANFPYNSSPSTMTTNQANLANYAYAALAHQTIAAGTPALSTASYQQ
jgi:hypothetical protein